MDKTLIKQIDKWIYEHKEEMLSDIARLIAIESVSQSGNNDAPFGEGCKNALLEMLKIGTEHGFTVQSFENRCGALFLSKQEPKIGIWGHLDVVPAGDGWQYPPFEMTIKDGYLIGRGAQDNKAPTVAALYILLCIKELKIPLPFGLTLFVGCDEENGMRDLDYYTANYSCPSLSIIPDCGFPVCYGEKGIIEFTLSGKSPLGSFVKSFHGGTASNIVPDYAEIVLQTTTEVSAACKLLDSTVTVKITDETVTVYAIGISQHTAFPDGGVNAIEILLNALAKARFPASQDIAELNAFAAAVKGFYGEGLSIECSDEYSGRLTCVGSRLWVENDIIKLGFNLRYPITADADKLLNQINSAAQSCELKCTIMRHSPPNHFPKEHPAVSALTRVYNEMTGDSKQAYVMGGGTYARKLPNAFAFGMGMDKNPPSPPSFLEGHGGCHSPDEAQNIQNLLDAMRIMLMGLVELSTLDKLVKLF